MLLLRAPPTFPPPKNGRKLESIVWYILYFVYIIIIFEIFKIHLFWSHVHVRHKQVFKYSETKIRVSQQLLCSKIGPNLYCTNCQDQVNHHEYLDMAVPFHCKIWQYFLMTMTMTMAVCCNYSTSPICQFIVNILS